MVRATKSRVDAGDAAMLTFLLDKQDSFHGWRSGLNRPDTSAPISLQTAYHFYAIRSQALSPSSRCGISSGMQIPALQPSSQSAIPARLLLRRHERTGRFGDQTFSSLCNASERCKSHILSEDAQSGHRRPTSHAGVTRSR